jgi:hypothetical protein
MDKEQIEEEVKACDYGPPYMKTVEQKLLYILLGTIIFALLFSLLK